MRLLGAFAGDLDLLDLQVPGSDCLSASATSSSDALPRIAPAQEVVEVVGDAAGQPPDALHLLRLAQAGPSSRRCSVTSK